MRSLSVFIVAALFCFVVISAKPSPPATTFRNTFHGYLVCESGVLSDIVKGTKHVKLWEPHRKQMDALLNNAKACTTKKDVKDVKKCEIELKPKLVDILQKFVPQLKKINPEYEFVVTFLTFVRCDPIRPNDILDSSRG